MIKWNIKGDTIEITASAKVTDKDYEELLPVLDNMLATYERPKFFIILNHFEGWEVSAIWTDMKYGLKHRGEFGAMAIVGDNITQKWLAQFSDIFFPTDIHYFKKTEESQARDWLAAQNDNAEHIPEKAVAGK